ncbi:MAG: hypothetical protein ABI042_11160 [Verrucomicrobiota bacterium]
MDHWNDFQKEKAVAIGWSAIKTDPTRFGNFAEFKLAIKPKKGSPNASRTIWNFANEWQTGDIVVMCVGYPPNQKKSVHLYGFARIIGKFFFDQNSTWWHFKRKAEIRPVEQEIPLTIFREIFGRSMLQTVHGPFSEKKFLKFSEQVRKLYPKVWRGMKTRYTTIRPARKNRRDDGYLLPEEIEKEESHSLYEGAKRLIEVNAYERNPKARRECIAHYGSSCCICKFIFAEGYGQVGAGLIHVHHLRRLSQIAEEYRVDPVRDLRPVCPNCHAIIHKRKNPYSLEEVRKFLKEASRKTMRCS